MELIIFKVTYPSEERSYKQNEFLSGIIRSGYSSRVIVDEEKGIVMRLNKNEYGKLVPDGASSSNMMQMMGKYQREGVITTFEESRNIFNEKGYKGITDISFRKEDNAMIFDNPRYFWDGIKRNEIQLSNDKEYIVLVDEFGCAVCKVNEKDSKITQEAKGFIKRKYLTHAIINPKRKEIYISCFGKKVVEILDLNTFKKITSLSHKGWVYDMAYCENDKLACCDGDGFLTMWDLTKGEVLCCVRQPMEYSGDGKVKNPKIPIEEIVTSPDGSLLATAAHDAYKDPLVVWKSDNGSLVAKFPRTIFSKKMNTYTQIAGFANNDTLVLYESGPEESAVFYYSYATGEIKEENFVGTIADVSSNGKYILIHTAENHYQLYTGKEAKTYPYIAGRNFRNSQFSEDGARLVMIGEDGNNIVLSL